MMSEESDRKRLRGTECSLDSEFVSNDPNSDTQLKPPMVLNRI